jgi:hypothetical protein
MEPTERITLPAIGLTVDTVPVRRHNPHKPSHERIQKKWIKRFGLKEVRRVIAGSHGMPEVKTVTLSRRALQKLESAAREANAPTPEQEKATWEAKLVQLCERMIEECRVGGWTRVQFNVADEAEKAFIEQWMGQHAPLAPLTFTINEVPA